MIRTTTLRLRTIRWKGKNKEAPYFDDLNISARTFLSGHWLYKQKVVLTTTCDGITTLRYRDDYV